MIGREFELILRFPVPSKKNKYQIHVRGKRKWIGKAKEVEVAEDAIALIARAKLPKDLKTPVRVEIYVTQSNKRKRLQDCDNVVGAIFDGLVKSKRIKDDSMGHIGQLEVIYMGRGDDEVCVKIIELS